MQNYPEGYYTKTPLDYQITEYDCGTTTMLNAIRYLFKRKEISPAIYREIMQYTLDVTNKNGEYGKGGTSSNAIDELSDLLNKIGPENGMNIECTDVSNVLNITDKEFKDEIDNGSIAILRVNQSDEHYVLLTKIDEKYAYLFDPYYLPIDYYDNDDECEIIKDKPFEYNRKVTIDRLISKSNKDFSLVQNENKQINLIKRK